MCAISINSYNWDWSESEGKRSKQTPLLHMRLWLEMLSLKHGIHVEQQKITFVGVFPNSHTVGVLLNKRVLYKSL